MDIEDKIEKVFGIVIHICAIIIMLNFTLWLTIQIYNEIIK